MQFRSGNRKFDALEGLRGGRRSAFALLSGRQCNFRCIHCLTDSGPGRKEFTTPETAEKILNNIKPAMKNENVFFIAIIGGEPMLNLEFVRAVVKKLIETSSELKIQVPIICMETNGTAWDPAIVSVFKPVMERVRIYHSPDEFHPKASMMQIFERNGFDIEGRRPDKKIAALGRGYALDGDYNWKTNCDAAGIAYEKTGDSIVMLKRRNTTSRFMVMENGDMALCGYGGLIFGNLAKESVFDIADKLQKDERAKALMEKGPLGLAELMGKAKEAVEILRKKGSCGICHALKEKLI
ncbi:radical SAM protein [Candidatus Micrarchaeota archaeon]|nr:radical SAM protein [Candidatus Micrarchaeota archaeon]